MYMLTISMIISTALGKKMIGNLKWQNHKFLMLLMPNELSENEHELNR